MSEYLLIDTEGNEHSLGGSNLLSGVEHGWVMSQTIQRFGNQRDIDTFFYNCQTKESVAFPIAGNYPFRFEGYLKVVHTPFNAGGSSSTGLWDIVRTCPILDNSYKDIFVLQEDEGTFTVIDKNNHLQFRRSGDKLVRDCGLLDGKYLVLRDEQPSLVVYQKLNKQNRCYCIDLRSGMRHGPEFTCIGELSEGIRHVRLLDGKDYIVDKDWTILYELPLGVHIGGGGFERIESDVRCRNGLISVIGEKTSYLINQDGEMVIGPRKHRYIHNVGASRLLVSKGRELALADSLGNLITDFSYKSSSVLNACGSIDDCDNYFAENRLFVVKKHGRDLKFGCLDADGREVIPFVYDMVEVPKTFSFGYATVRYDE